MTTETERDTTYNGWTNYETWNVRLHIDNDRGDQSQAMELAAEVRRNPEWCFLGTAEPQLANEGYRVGKMIREWIEERADEEGRTGPADMFTDLLQAALQSVNWQEIGQSYIDALDEAIEYDAKNPDPHHHHELCACDACADEDDDEDEEEEEDDDAPIIDPTAAALDRAQLENYRATHAAALPDDEEETNS